MSGRLRSGRGCGLIGCLGVVYTTYGRLVVVVVVVVGGTGFMTTGIVATRVGATMVVLTLKYCGYRLGILMPSPKC